MNRDKQFKETEKLISGPEGTSIMFERFAAPTLTGKPFMEGVVMVRAADGILSEPSLSETPFGVIPGVFEVHDALVCVVLVAVGKQYFPIYVNLRNEREVAPLRVMSRQGYAELFICDGSRAMANLQVRPPENMFAGIFEVLEHAKPWTEAQYREARKAFELSFEGDLEGLEAAITSGANSLLAREPLNLADAQASVS